MQHTWMPGLHIPGPWVPGPYSSSVYSLPLRSWSRLASEANHVPSQIDVRKGALSLVHPNPQTKFSRAFPASLSGSARLLPAVL